MTSPCQAADAVADAISAAWCWDVSADADTVSIRVPQTGRFTVTIRSLPAAAQDTPAPRPEVKLMAARIAEAVSVCQPWDAVADGGTVIVHATAGTVWLTVRADVLLRV